MFKFSCVRPPRPSGSIKTALSSAPSFNNFKVMLTYAHPKTKNEACGSAPALSGLFPIRKRVGQHRSPRHKCTLRLAGDM